jgi:hypothetical protein
MPRRFKGYCSITGCDKPIRTLGMCQTHYWRLWKHGDEHHNVNPRQPEECIVDGCHRKPNAHGLCMSHCARLYRLGTSLPERPIRKYRRKR